MDKEKILIKNTIPVKDFCNLRESVNFQKLTEQQAEKVLKNTSAVVAVEYEGKYIGLTRILFDFGTDAYITDVIVHPDYQGFGIGGILIENAIDYLKKNAVEGVRIACSLYTNPGKEDFYGKFGFEKLPNNKYGYGMLIEI